MKAILKDKDVSFLHSSKSEKIGADIKKFCWMILSTWKSVPWKSYFYCMTKKEEVRCFSETLVITNLIGGCNQMIRMNMDCHDKPNFHSVWISVWKLHWANCLSSMFPSNTHSSDQRRNLNVVFWLFLSLLGNACYKLIINIYCYTSLNKVFIKFSRTFKGIQIFHRYHNSLAVK